MPRGDGTGPRGRGAGGSRGAGTGIGIISGVTGIAWDLLKKYKKGKFSASAQGPPAQPHFGMEAGVEKAGVPASTPRALSPVPTPSELEDLKKNSAELKDQLDKITERLSKLEAKK